MQPGPRPGCLMHHMLCLTIVTSDIAFALVYHSLNSLDMGDCALKGQRV